MEELSSPTDSLSPSCQDTDSRCPICLSSFTQHAFTDPCFHSFCLSCILQWAEVSASCPMCKTTVTKIIYDVKANDLYQVYKVQAPSKPTTSGGWGGEAGSSGSGGRFWYHSSLVPGQPAHRRRVQQSRVAATEERRRVVYSLGMRVKPLPAERGRVRVRDISARFFRSNPASIHRLIPWLVREFKVLVGKDHADFMVQLILSLINNVDLESDTFAQHLRPFLHGRTDHFMHELISFAKSPFDMIAYDERSNYDFVPSSPPHQDQPGPSRVPTTLWPDVEPYDVAAARDNTLVGQSWESPPLHPVRDGPSTQGTPTPVVIDITTPESSPAHQSMPPEGRTMQAVEGEGSSQQGQYNSGHSPLDLTLDQQSRSSSHQHRSPSPSHNSKRRSPSHRSKHRSPSHHSKRRHRSPSYHSKHRSPSHHSKHRSPSHHSKHRSPSHHSKHRSPSHHSKHRSPSHHSKHRSPSHHSKHRSPSHHSKHSHRSPSASGLSKSRGKERSREQRSRSRGKERARGQRSSSRGKERSREQRSSSRGKERSRGQRSSSRGKERSREQRSSSRGKERSRGQRSSSRGKERSRGQRSSSRGKERARGQRSSSRGKERNREQRSRSRGHSAQDSAVSSTTARGLQEELCCVKEEIKDNRAKLLQGLLQEERTTFLQSKLKEECQWTPPSQGNGASEQGGRWSW